MDPLEEARTRVHCATDSVRHGTAIEYAGALASSGIDNSFDAETFKKNLKIEIISLDEDDLVFDLIGVDAPIANALRRILIAEVPTMAIEKVFMMINTSIIQDEVLAHRLGLVPIKVDPRLFEYREADQEETPQNCSRFNLEVRCAFRPDGKSKTDPEERYENSNVFSRHLEWDPLEGQADIMPEITTVHDDILLAKLRPGQAVQLQAVIEKGIGKTHAKWSPVSTASYRLLPEIVFKKGKVEGDEAVQIKEACPMGVFDIEDLGGTPSLRVDNPRACTMCRECIRDPKHDKLIKLLRVRDHYIFSVESTGCLPPLVLLQEAIKIFVEKCTSTLARLEDAKDR